MSKFNRPWAIGIIIFGIAILAFIAGMLIMSFGVGISTDSVCYIDGARSILARLSFSCYGHIVTRYPPGYSLLLAINSLFRSDPLITARWLHAYMYGLNSALVGLLVYLSTNKSGPAAIIAQLLFLLSPSMLILHTMAWSEPADILLLLLAFLFFILYTQKPVIWWLLLTSFLAGLIIITRYAGISVVPAIILAILLLKYKPFKERLKDCLIFLVIAVFPLGIWMVRNKLSANAFTDRALVFHPIARSQIISFFSTFVKFLLTQNASRFSLNLIIFVITSSLILLGIFISTKASLKDKHPNSVNIITQHLLINYILTYLLVLFFSITFFDASITLDERILSPVFVIGLILIFSVIYKVSNISGKPVVWKACILVFLVFIYINALPFRRAASDIQKNGEGFASLSWQQSASIRYLKSLPKEILIYTNAPDVAYILTGKYASSLPNVDNRVTTVLNPTFISEMDKLKNDLSQKDTYVLFFNNLHRDNIPTRNDLVNKYHFPVLLELADGTVFGIGQ